MTEKNIFDAMEIIGHGLADERIRFNDKYNKLLSAAQTKLGAIERASTESDVVVLDALNVDLEASRSVLAEHGQLKNGKYILKSDASDEATKLFHDAEKDYASIKGKITAFFRSEKVEGFEQTISDGAKTAFAEAEEAVHSVTKPTLGWLGTVRTQKDGFTKALKQNGEKMQFWKEGMTVGERGKAFAHGGAAVGAVVGMGDAIFRSKNSEGEDRSALMRMAEFVVAGGVGAVALVGGPAMAR